MTAPRGVTYCFRKISFLFPYSADLNTRMTKGLFMIKISTKFQGMFLSICLSTALDRDWLDGRFPHFHWSIQIKIWEGGGGGGTRQTRLDWEIDNT